MRNNIDKDKQFKITLISKFIMICILIIIFGYSYIKSTNLNPMEGYKNLPSTHNFIQSSFIKTNELLKSDDFTGIIYYGYTDCPWCQEAVPLMNDAFDSLELDGYIYYVDKKAVENSDGKVEEKAVEIIEEDIDLQLDENGQPHLYGPEVLVVKNGVIIAHNTGTVDSHDATQDEMSEDERLDLFSRYVKIFGEIKE